MEIMSWFVLQIKVPLFVCFYSKYFFHLPYFSCIVHYLTLFLFLEKPLLLICQGTSFFKCLSAKFWLYLILIYSIP